MRVITIKIAGVERYLLFNGAAMFAFRDEFEGPTEVLEAISADTRDGFTTTCKAIALLAEQGELARRFYGYDPVPILTAEEIEGITTPADITAMKLAIPTAIAVGYGREVDTENDEVDIGLMELNQKKTK